MSTQTIFIIAMIVFALMIVGIILTMVEFNRITEDPSRYKGSSPPHLPNTEQ